MSSKYAKGVAAGSTGVANVVLAVVLDAVAQADTWVTGLVLALANVIGTVLVVRLKNAEKNLRDYAAESVAD